MLGRKTKYRTEFSEEIIRFFNKNPYEITKYGDKSSKLKRIPVELPTPRYSQY